MGRALISWKLLLNPNLLYLRWSVKSLLLPYSIHQTEPWRTLRKVLPNTFFISNRRKIHPSSRSSDCYMFHPYTWTGIYEGLLCVDIINSIKSIKMVRHGSIMNLLIFIVKEHMSYWDILPWLRSIMITTKFQGHYSIQKLQKQTRKECQVIMIGLLNWL